MNAERFSTLAEAFGGDVRRWPEAERDQALAYVAAEPAAAEQVLAEARELDFVLGSVSDLQPSRALRDRVLASAPKTGWQARRFGWSTPWLGALSRGWFAPGAGLAAACVAGAWLGVAASHNVDAQLRADTVLVASADLSAPEAEELAAQ